MAKADVTVYSKDGDSEVTIPGVDNISLIDNESHGAGRTFGLTETRRGRSLLIASPNVSAVIIDHK